MQAILDDTLLFKHDKSFLYRYSKPIVQQSNSSMVKRKVKVLNEAGLHARPSSVLVQAASKFQSDLFIEMYGYRVNGKSILGLMTLAAEEGAEMELIAEGPDEEEAIETLSQLFKNKFRSE